MTEVGRRRGLTRTAAVIFYGFYVLVYVQAAVNMLVIASKSRTILDILKACSSMESRLGLRRAAVSRRLTKVSHWCLALALLESAKYVASGKKVVPAALKRVRLPAVCAEKDCCHDEHGGGCSAVLFYGQGVFFMCATSFGIMLSGVSMVDRMLSTYYALSMAILLRRFYSGGSQDDCRG
ncbi:hypothetical protein HPB48_022463 [Haemaphysalis longicornis]|uniref:Uncharacterized protein n=1 Tax=Haemaphysalis longicornis TaxID=44386 RepID=A0A9J6G4I1_HAELO|nr:hypothetical protein HPB48_022463 [Haemaphysalis longicornis]